MGCTCIREEREGNRVIKTHKLKPRRIFTQVLFIGGTLITKRGSNLNQWAGEYYNTVPQNTTRNTCIIYLGLPGNKGRNTKTRRYFITIPGMQLILLGTYERTTKKQLTCTCGGIFVKVFQKMIIYMYIHRSSPLSFVSLVIA